MQDRRGCRAPAPPPAAAGADREGALAVGRPAPGLVAAGAAGDHLDLVGDHERRIEADAELADQGGAFAGLVRLEPLHEGLGAGARDGAERLDHLVAAHADAVVLDRERAGVGVDADGDARLGVVAEQRRRRRWPRSAAARRRPRRWRSVRAGTRPCRNRPSAPSGAAAGDIGLEGAAFGLGFGSGGHGRRSSRLVRPRRRWRENR